MGRALARKMAARGDRIFLLGRNEEDLQASAADLEAKLSAVLRDWTNITTKPTVQKRQLLRKLLPERITVMPHVKGTRRWVDFHGNLALAPIISGIAPAVGDVLPDDRGHRWWPQRDSNPCFSLERAVS